MSENDSTKGREMKSQLRPTLFALSVVLLCTFQETTSSSQAARGSSASSASAPTSPSEEEAGGTNQLGLGVPQNQLNKTNTSWTHFSNDTSVNHGNDSRLTPKIFKEESGHVNDLLHNTSRDNIPTVISERSRPSWKEEAGGAPICAYRVIEGGISGPLCFRNTHFRFQCSQSDCRTVKSMGSLVANILTNGSVLLQWAHHDGTARENIQRKAKEKMTDHEAATANVSGQKAPFTHPPPKTVFNGKSRRRQGGFELSCWWNGSYTQFECATVRLAAGCRDFLLTELHENIPYRICLRSLLHSDPAVRGASDLDCVEFTVAPSGMQDIVIAMTTVGGAICVMLVIICLLVAYITENIMSPATQHTYSYHTRSHH